MRGRKVGLVRRLAGEKQSVVDRVRQDCTCVRMAGQRMAVGAAYPIGTTPGRGCQGPQVAADVAAEQ